MPADRRQPEITYVVHFRTSRGAGGVLHETARAELLAATGNLPVSLVGEHPARNRLRVRVPAGCEPDLLQLMPRLGYTEALVQVTRHPGAGLGVEHRPPRKVERWLVGAYRRGDDLEIHELIWRADEQARLARSPHSRPFKVRIDGEIELSLGRRRHRRLSCCDAMVMLNLARVDAGALVVDPFAGIGGIALEARRMGLQCLSGDIALALAPGLREVSGGLAAIWDAAALPLSDACADAVVTEPPYEEQLQADVAAAMPEMARILKPCAYAVVLMQEELADDTLQAAASAGLTSCGQHPIRRAGGLMARVMVLQHRR
ncbi:MAG: hypothetical protein U9R79_22545 [Armatimonadota bacterium]|nr:hypothetical protein [Armatimonadota bacterium]